MVSEPQKLIFMRRFIGTDLFHSVLSEIPHICNRIEIFIGIMWAQQQSAFCILILTYGLTVSQNGLEFGLIW